MFDRSIVDKRDYDRSSDSADADVKPKLVFAISFSGRGASFENRREGDRIIQDTVRPIRDKQYTVYVASSDVPAVAQGGAAPAAAPVASATTEPAPNPARPAKGAVAPAKTEPSPAAKPEPAPAAKPARTAKAKPTPEPQLRTAEEAPKAKPHAKPAPRHRDVKRQPEEPRMVRAGASTGAGGLQGLLR
jgi:hypothetical protein